MSDNIPCDDYYRTNPIWESKKPKSLWEAKVDKIQMTEEQVTAEQVRIVFKHIAFSEDETIEHLKQAGCIKKDIIEEVEEMYYSYMKGKNCMVSEIVLNKMFEAILHLKADIRKLNSIIKCP